MVGDKAMSGCFKPEVVPKLQVELYKIQKEALKFKYKTLCFGAFDEVIVDSGILQCFWLNLLNFMILFRMAELLLCDCSSLKKLTSYSMWEALLGSSTIYISKVCLTAS